jgi:hemerythrin-like domain-containing protein
MDCIDLMVQEHRNIKRMLAVIRKYCYRILKNEDIRYEVFFEIIDFIRGYADRHHHGKEEELLFSRMLEEMGPLAEKLVRHGMLVEHDLGRLHVGELEEAVRRVMAGDDEARLDVIANAISYTHLLTRHIDKEDGAVYGFAAKNLREETMKSIEEECRRFEETASADGTVRRYLDLLDRLEADIGTSVS